MESPRCGDFAKAGLPLSRRRFFASGLAVFLSGFLSGCVRDPVVSNVVSVFRHLTSGRPDQEIDRDTVARLPYALVRAKLGNGPRAVLLLNRNENDDRYWVSAEKATVVTRHGRIVKTAGFEQNLAYTQASQGDPLAQSPHEMDAPRSYSRQIDLRSQERYESIAIESVLEIVEPRTIEILDLEFDTILIREKSSARTVNWKFENLYWVDVYDGFVWKSRQHFVRGLPPMEIEVLKPAA